MTGWDLIGVFIFAGLALVSLSLLSLWEPISRRIDRWDERSGDDAE